MKDLEKVLTTAVTILTAVLTINEALNGHNNDGRNNSSRSRSYGSGNRGNGYGRR